MKNSSTGRKRFGQRDKMLSSKSGVWLGGDALDDVALASRPVLVAAELLAVSEFA